MQLYFIISLVFAILVAIFAIMNSEVVTISLFWKEFQLSQSVVILSSTVFGAMIAALLSGVSKVKSSLKIRELNKKLKRLEDEMTKLTTSEKSLEDNVEFVVNMDNSSSDNN